MSVTRNIASDGAVRWFLNEKLHRGGDLPAIEYANGNKWWYRHGQLHRDGDLPAIEFPSRTKYWYKNNQQHRDGLLPAVEYADGGKEWHKYGAEYRIDQLIDCYSQLTNFGRLSLGKIKINRLKRVRWIHGELLCRPLRGNFPGGQDYHKMVGYFNKL